MNYAEFLKSYISDPDALVWCLIFTVYCHSVDDIIDGDKTDAEHILKTFGLATHIYSYPFYLQHINILKPLCDMAHNSYRDSVVLERRKNPAKWEKHVGDVIRQNANEVILACIQISSGLDARNDAALKLRELSYITHHEPDGKPV